MTLATISPGQWSLDPVILSDPDWNGWTGMALSAGLGLIAATGVILTFYKTPQKAAA